jgi:hypothetical protein
MDSWWLKLDRAENHFPEFQEMIAPLLDRCMNPVSKGWESKDNEWGTAYRVRFAIPEPDERLAVVAGDVMFNVRSALDHIAVAVAPVNRKYDASFPILTCDVHEIDEIAGGYLHASDRRYWLRCTKGMADDTVAFLDSVQPYKALSTSQDPNDHALALLSSFQNADKHRELVVVARGLTSPDFYYHLPGDVTTVLPFDRMDIPADRLVKDGAMVEFIPGDEAPEMEMEVEGTPQVVIGRAIEGPLRGCPGVLGKMIDTAKRVVGKLSVDLA